MALGFAEIPFLSLTAVEAGSRAVGQLGKFIAAHDIARPHDDLTALLPK